MRRMSIWRKHVQPGTDHRSLRRDIHIMLGAREADVELVGVLHCCLLDVRGRGVELPLDVFCVARADGQPDLVVVLDVGDLVRGRVVHQRYVGAVVRPQVWGELNADTVRGRGGQKVISEPLEKRQLSAGLSQGSELT